MQHSCIQEYYYVCRDVLSDDSIRGVAKTFLVSLKLRGTSSVGNLSAYFLNNTVVNIEPSPDVRLFYDK